MDINAIIDRLNTELEKLNNLKKQSMDTSTFFTSNENFNDDFSFNNSESDSISFDNTNINNSNIYEDIEPDNETTSLVTIKERRLLAAQNMFKKSIRVSLKSFLISITLSFLNLFI